MNPEALQTLTTLCTDVMRCDQFRFQKRIRNLKSRKGDITKPFERGVSGMIACTQPRRIASELETFLGNAVGYKVRFSD